MRVVSENWSQLQTIAVGVWVDMGSRHETQELNGIAHFLEHIMFKGTQRRSARDIAEEIEAPTNIKLANCIRLFLELNSL